MKGKGNCNISTVKGFYGPLVNGSDSKINPPKMLIFFVLIKIESMQCQSFSSWFS